jgi:hypothetical protein
MEPIEWRIFSSKTQLTQTPSCRSKVITAMDDHQATQIDSELDLSVVFKTVDKPTGKKYEKKKKGHILIFLSWILETWGTRKRTLTQPSETPTAMELAAQVNTEMSSTLTPQQAKAIEAGESPDKPEGNQSQCKLK